MRNKLWQRWAVSVSRQKVWRMEPQTCRRISVLALFQRQREIFSVFSVFFHFSAPKTARKEVRKCRLFPLYSGKRRHFRTEKLYILYRCTVSRWFALISRWNQREILFSFMFSARKQREMPIFPNQRDFALIFQREQKGCCRHVWWCTLIVWQ